MKARPTPTLRSISQFEIGWIVGFLEGEGSFYTQQRSTIVIKALQVQREPIERLVRYTGLGKVGGPYTRAKTGRTVTVHEWAISGPNVIALLALIRQHMSPRRQAQIDRALAQYEARPRADYKAARRKATQTLRARRYNDPNQLRLVQG